METCDKQQAEFLYMHQEEWQMPEGPVDNIWEYNHPDGCNV